MNCKYCGAPLNAEAETCPYCGNVTPHGEALAKSKHGSLPTMKHVSTIAAVLLYVITLGVYGPVWYVLRVRDLNKLESDSKLPVIIPIVQLAVCAAFYVLSFSCEGVDTILTWCKIILFVLSIVMAFRVRKILRGHTFSIIIAKRDESKLKLYARIAPSSVLLFLIGPLYLQHTINKMFRLELLRPSV